jgi:hypothetical protein
LRRHVREAIRRIFTYLTRSGVRCNASASLVETAVPNGVAWWWSFRAKTDPERGSNAAVQMQCGD